jgi:hypothetical protein
MKWVTTAAAVEAAATGLILLLSSVLFGRLILEAELSEPGQALGRLAGIALLGFALTSWPAPSAPVCRSGDAYLQSTRNHLSFLSGYRGKVVGVLLWPAVALHLLLTVLLAAERMAARRACNFKVVSGRYAPAAETIE